MTQPNQIVEKQKDTRAARTDSLAARQSNEETRWQQVQRAASDQRKSVPAGSKASRGRYEKNARCQRNFIRCQRVPLNTNTQRLKSSQSRNRTAILLHLSPENSSQKNFPQASTSSRMRAPSTPATPDANPGFHDCCKLFSTDYFCAFHSFSWGNNWHIVRLETMWSSGVLLDVCMTL